MQGLHLRALTLPCAKTQENGTNMYTPHVNVSPATTTRNKEEKRKEDDLN